MHKYETKVCPKMWAYFAQRAGWLKINVGTNLGPQIYMYLSALGILTRVHAQDELINMKREN